MAEDIRIEYRALDDILEYENNPRRNDDAVAAVAESMKEFGCRQPIVIDADGIIVAGHTRYKAARLLKWEKMPCILADDLTEEQIRAYRLADNKTAEASEWDEQRLAVELSEILDIDMSRFGFEDEESLADVIDEEKYSMATNIPQYEIKGDCPELSDLLDTEKSDELVAEIENADVTEEEKEFLRYAAQRHNVFNYRNVAEYYAHATPQMQELMEKSALVIIDVDNAIANGYATLQAEILDIMED